MNNLEEAIRQFINNLRTDIEVTEDLLGGDERMGAVVSAQRAFCAELEDILNEYDSYEEEG